jgi:broad specificity phosphatase PhoE
VIDLPDPAGATRLVVVRHPEPVESAAGRCYGSLDVELSAAGLAHAARLGEVLSGLRLAGVYTSPRIRAAHAAQAIGAPLGLQPAVAAGLRELDFGELEGRPYDDIRRERPELYRRWMEAPTTVRFPGGEGFEDLRRRSVAAVEEILSAHPGAAAAVVTHGGVARAVLAHALGMPGEAIFAIDQRYGAVNVIDWYDGRPLVRLVNGAA